MQQVRRPVSAIEPLYWNFSLVKGCFHNMSVAWSPCDASRLQPLGAGANLASPPPA
jgi:hypothetical protein